MPVVTAMELRPGTPLHVRHLVARDEQFAQSQVAEVTLSGFARHLLQPAIQQKTQPDVRLGQTMRMYAFARYETVVCLHSPGAAFTFWSLLSRLCTRSMVICSG